MGRNQALDCRGYRLEFDGRPLVMGIINVTPDSFSDGGQFDRVNDALAHAHRLAAEGADIIDIGGESTRPGADAVSIEQETERVLPVIEQLVSGPNALDLPISVDTRKAAVAAAALKAGAHLVNDVSAASDPEMAAVVAGYRDVPMILMHMKGVPKSMQQQPYYQDVVAEVSEYLGQRAQAVAAAGIAPNRVLLDPGIGFGKRLEDNLDLLHHVDQLQELGYPLLVGASRKTFIGLLLDQPTDQRLSGSLAVAAHCWQRGVEVVRVHDVRETVELFAVLDAIHHPDTHRK